MNADKQGWRVGRVHSSGRVEYLDNDRDVFYFEGVRGYESRDELIVRVARYKDSLKGLFIESPRYARSKIKLKSA